MRERIGAKIVFVDVPSCQKIILDPAEFAQCSDD
jgi:hypothetical protein